MLNELFLSMNADTLGATWRSSCWGVCFQRAFLIARANVVVPPFGETVQQVFARISALRDSLDGPSLDDQGLFNTDPRAQAVPELYVNFVPTDIQGITFGRTPQQVRARLHYSIPAIVCALDALHKH